MYHITSNPSESLIRIGLAGLPDQTDFDLFHKDLIRHVRQAKAGGSSFNLLIDLREGPVLPQSHIGNVTEIVKNLVDQGLRCTAILVASVLVKLQVARVISGATAEFFSDEAEALTWLDRQE